MRVMAQLSMVMNLDKCIGCHTCSVTCKQAWTNRPGVEYVWFNNVETRPGQGYPRTYEDQERWEGGWVRDKRGRLRLRAGGRIKKLATIFSNPKMPSIDDYYEPWTYDYENLTNAPLGEQMPVAPPRSLITGEPMKVEWSANWDDNLGGSTEILAGDPILAKVSQQVKLELEQTLHVLPAADLRALPEPVLRRVLPVRAPCTNAPRTASCWSTRTSASGWRMCVTGCPYKKVYFNHRTGKAEKCTFCYPRIEVGLPTVCARPASAGCGTSAWCCTTPTGCWRRRRRRTRPTCTRRNSDVMLDPNDPAVIAGAREHRASPTNGWTPPAGHRSTRWPRPTGSRCRCTRNTAPCRWSGTCRRSRRWSTRSAGTGTTGRTPDNLFGAIEALRIPIEYLAGLFTAGDTAVVTGVLQEAGRDARVHAGHQPGP